LLHKDINKWDLIFDFTKQESGELNYSIIDPKDWKMEYIPVEGIDAHPVTAFPYPVRYGGTIPDDAYFGEDKDEKMETFDIKTSAADAAKQVQKKEIQEAIKVSASDSTKASKYLADSHKDILLGSNSSLKQSQVSIKTNEKDQENLNN
jgi:hypothetical protein